MRDKKTLAMILGVGAIAALAVVLLVFFKGNDNETLDLGGQDPITPAGQDEGSSAAAPAKVDPIERPNPTGAATTVPARAETAVVTPKPGTASSVNPGEVIGTVQNRRTHKPVAGAHITLVHGEAANLPTTTTDSKGLFRLSGLAPGAGYRLTVSCKGYENLTSVSFSLDTAKGHDAGALGLIPLPIIQGKVYDHAKKPIPKARVTVTQVTGMPLGPGLDLGELIKKIAVLDKALARTETDGRGFFIFYTGELPTGDYTVRASAPKKATGMELRVSVKPGEEVKDLEILLLAGLGLKGKVFDQTGTPLEAALIILLGQPDERTMMEGHLSFKKYCTETAKDGSFSFEDLQKDRYMLMVKKDGFPNKMTDGVRVPMKDEIIIELQAGFVLEGKVLDSHTGEPVAGAKIALMGRRGGGFGQAVSDEKGAYRIENLSPGRYRCIVSAEGYLPMSDRLPESTPGGTTVFDIRLSKGVTITGRVVDSATGKPLADVEIISMTGRGDMAVLTGGPVKTRSGPDGKFTLEGVKIQEKVNWSREGQRKVEKTMAVIIAHKSGWEQENSEFETTPGNDLPGVELRMHAMPQATGTVVGPDGKPIANAEVVVIAGGNPENWDVMILTDRKAESIRTDALGRFTAFLPDGKKVFIAVLHPAFAYKVVQYTDMVAGSRPDPVTVKLGPGGTVEGTVLDPHGNPLPGIPVALQPKGNSKQDLRSVMHHPLMQKYLPKIRSDAKGRFTIPHLPSGKWRLAVQPQQGGASFEEIVDVTQGRTVQAAIRTQPLLTIEGIVVDHGGNALSGVQVWASMEKGTGNANDESGSDGTFKLVGLAAGRYTVSLWHPDYPYTRVSGIEAGAMGLRLVMEKKSEEEEKEEDK